MDKISELGGRPEPRRDGVLGAFDVLVGAAVLCGSYASIVIAQSAAPAWAPWVFGLVASSVAAGIAHAYLGLRLAAIRPSVHSPSGAPERSLAPQPPIDSESLGADLVEVFATVSKQLGKAGLDDDKSLNKPLMAILAECEWGMSLATQLVQGDAARSSVEHVEPVDDALDGSAREILLCEDDDAIRTLISTCLTGRGFVVHSASNGSAALDQARKHAPQIGLLICDLNLLGLSGWEVAEQFRRTVQRGRVLLISGHSENSIDPADLRSVEADYLAKPFTTAELLARVESILGPHRARS